MPVVFVSLGGPVVCSNPETCGPVHSHSTHHMVLHLVGVGLGDEQDITLKGLNALKRCSKIYLEAYTSVLTVPKEQLEPLTHRRHHTHNRRMVPTGQASH